MASIKPVSAIALNGPRRWGIDGILSGLTLLWGGPGLGKSFVAVSMGVSVATGRPWMGRATKQGPVIYIAGEGGEEGVAHRVRAALNEWTVDLEEERDIPFYIISPGINLVENGIEFADLVGIDIERKPSLIVVDTLSRCFVGDENKQEFMAQFVRTLDHLREHYRSDILVIHHANKQREVRGSSVLFGAVDVSWALNGGQMKGGEKMLSMRADKLRERPSEGALLKFRATPRKLVGPGGRQIIDEFGDEQTTLVVKPIVDDLKVVSRIRDVGLAFIEANGGYVSYKQWRSGEPGMRKHEFDNALSFIVTFPGRWGIMRGSKVGTYVKSVAGIENSWNLLV